jgi:hypothetical protein
MRARPSKILFESIVHDGIVTLAKYSRFPGRLWSIAINASHCFRERGSAARCHYLQAKLANGTKPSREDRDRKNPVTTDQMSWSNSTEREDINRFDPARQPDGFYGRDRHAQSSRAEVSDEYESFRRMG